jgi:hypothetical protein
VCGSATVRQSVWQCMQQCAAVRQFGCVRQCSSAAICGSVRLCAAVRAAVCGSVVVCGSAQCGSARGSVCLCGFNNYKMLN